MTNGDKQALGKRLLACKHWRWMPGMAMTDMWRCSNRIISIVPYNFIMLKENGELIALRETPPHQWPDITDPATIGCLLKLLECLREREVVAIAYGSQRRSQLFVELLETVP